MIEARSNAVKSIGNWNVRSMIQGKLEVVKQEMARVNVDILGINELKWTGMSEFNSGGHCIYYCGQESLGRNRVALIVNNGEGNNKPLQYSCLENPMNSMKRQKDMTLKDELHRSVGAQYATGVEK